MKKQKSYEEKITKRDKRELNEDPLKKLNKAKTTRLEKAFFAKKQFEEEYPTEEDWTSYLAYKEKDSWEEYN